MCQLTTDDRYAPLLSTQAEDLLETEDRVRPADLLPVESKAQLVISAAPDLIEAEKGLREIDILDKRGVAGAGDLEREFVLCLATSRLVLTAFHSMRRRKVVGRGTAVARLAAKLTFIRDHNARARTCEGSGGAESAP